MNVTLGENRKYVENCILWAFCHAEYMKYGLLLSSHARVLTLDSMYQLFAANKKNFVCNSQNTVSNGGKIKCN